MELGNEATSRVVGVGSISFLIPSSDALDLDDVLYVPGLMNSLLSVSSMTDLQWMVEFDG